MKNVQNSSSARRFAYSQPQGGFKNVELNVGVYSNKCSRM